MSRYSRHKNLYSPGAFSAIQHASVGVAGIGGLGSTILQLLARIGIGTIHFWDDALLDSPDLNRQLLYNTNHLNKAKTASALEELQKINPDIQYIAHHEKLQENSTVPKLDILIDCLDTFAARRIADMLFFKQGIPIVHGSVYREKGVVTSLLPGTTPNYQDSFGIDKNTVEVDEKEVFPPIVSLIASVQVSETIKFLTGQQSEMLLNKLFSVDLKTNQFETDF